MATTKKGRKKTKTAKQKKDDMRIAKIKKDETAQFKKDQAAKLKANGANGKDPKAPSAKSKVEKTKAKKDRDAKAAVDRDESGKKRIAVAKKALERSRNYAASGLAKQVTETLIDEIRALDKPWHQTPEASQAVVIARLSDRVYNAMQTAVQIMSAIGHKAVICNLFSVTFKDGVKATITIAPGSPMRHSLADHATKDVVLVLADPSVFMQGLADIKADADQPKLI